MNVKRKVIHSGCFLHWKTRCWGNLGVRFGPLLRLLLHIKDEDRMEGNP